MNVKLKLVFASVVLVGSLVLSTNPALAALVTVDKTGQLVWQVLGDETTLNIPKSQEITIKAVAQDQTLPTNSQLSLANDNGQITLNVQNGSGTQNFDVTNLKDNIIELQARPNTNDIKISNANGKFTIDENGVRAQTAFPLTIDPNKNELSVTTSSGNRFLSVLPYEAVLGLLRAKLIDNASNDQVTITENSKGELQYVIKGTKKINLFNVATISADVSSSVSASNGEVITVDEPQWLKLFGFLFS